MHLHHQHPSMKALAQYCLSKSQEESSSSLHAELQSLFSQSEKHIGLVICERLINMPVEVVPPLYNMLRDEVRNSIAANLPFKFSHLLFISRTYHLSLEEESILENTLPASQARKKKTRTKRQRPEGTDGTGKFGDAGRPEDGIYSFHAEDALLSSLGSHTLNYKYTTPPPETHQEKRGKDAFGLDVRGRMILVPMDIKSPSSDAMETDGTQDAWDVIAEQMMKVYGVSS
ncbi:bcp1 [Coprinopsis cinerea AmutBmut pab1-1]|nr:bcp1 [Coprinopsis cinerea AmutBmut pab1-1]